MRWNHLYTWWIWYLRYTEVTATYWQFVITVYSFAMWLITSFSDHYHSFFYRQLGRGVDDWFWETTPLSGYSYARLLLYFLTQARIGHWRFQGPHGGRVCDSISRVAELFINARILCHIGGGGGVEDQSQEDDEEGQQVKPWKLKPDKQHNELHIVCLKSDLKFNNLFILNRRVI